jgi:RND family efflux transporter MFP subunit
MKLKVLLPVVIVLASLAVAVTLIRNRQQIQPLQPQAVPMAVRVVAVEPAPVQLKVHAQGTVSPKTETELVPEVSGNVTWISPNLVSGGYFEADDPLLMIDDRDYRASAQRAEATLSRAQADHELAQFEYQRAVDLHGRQLISRADLETNLRAARVAEASLRDAELVLETALRDLQRTTVTAPFAGLVRSEQVDVGQFVNRGSAIASIYGTDYVEVRLPIADQQLAYLNVPLSQRGELAPELAPTVTLTAEFAGVRQDWNGRLVRTEAEIDPGSRMVYAIARVDPGEMGTDGEPVLPPPVGLFVQAEIDGLAKQNVVVLPRSAIRNGDQVLIVDTENRLHFRTVEILRVYRDDAFITGGLQAGELVSISALQTVVEGMRVQPILPES